MFSIKENVLFNMVSKDNISESEIDAIFLVANPDKKILFKIYNLAHHSQKYHIVRSLLKIACIKERFLFLGETYSTFLKKNEFEKLPLPFFEVTDLDIISLLQLLFKKGNIQHVKKGVELAIIKYGVNFLNNLLILREFIDISTNFNKIIALDHKTALPKEICKHLNTPEDPLQNLLIPYPNNELFSDINEIKFLLKPFLITKKFKILKSFNESDHQHIKWCLSKYLKVFTFENLNKKLTNANRKINSLHSILNILANESRIIENQRLANLPLNQEIISLDGKPLLDFIISVPRNGEDLFNTGKVLDHYLGEYTQIVADRIVQIMNLIKNDQIHYTLSISWDDGYYDILEFKRNDNESLFKGPQGAPYIKALKEMCGVYLKKDDPSDYLEYIYNPPRE